MPQFMALHDSLHSNIGTVRNELAVTLPVMNVVFTQDGPDDITIEEHLWGISDEAANSDIVAVQFSLFNNVSPAVGAVMLGISKRTLPTELITFDNEYRILKQLRI